MSLVDIHALAFPAFTAAVLAIHLIAFASIVGGTAMLVFPRVGGVLLLLSAIAWLLMVAFLGEGLTLGMGGLIALTTGGGLLAFLPSLNTLVAVLEPAGAPPAGSGMEFRGRPPDRPPELETDDRPSPFAPVPPRPVELPSIAAGYTFEQGALRELRYQSPRRRSRAGQVIFGVAALAVIVVGAGVALVAGNSWIAGTQSGEAQVAVAPSSAVSSSPVPASSAVAASSAAVVSSVPSIAAPAPSSAPVSAESASASEPAPVALPALSAALPPSSAAPASAAVVAPALYATPFDYCGIVADSDAPPTAGIGEGLPGEVVDGVRKVTKMPDAEVRWRCMGSNVWICAQPPGGSACEKAPTIAERASYCAAHPDAQGLEASVGLWRCSGSQPVLPADFDGSIDPRGFNRLAWLALTKAPAGAAG